MEKYFEVLKSCPLFFGIEEGNLRALLGCLGARVYKFDKKYTVFAEGSPAKHIGIVLSGAVQIIQHDYYGNRSILPGAEVGELFSETFACADVPELPVSVIAGEPSEIMLIEASRILNSCSSSCGFHHKMIYNLMKNMASKNIDFHRKLEVTSKRSTREKLLTYLDHQAKKHGSESFEIPFDRQELADFLGVDRSGLSSEIGKLKKEGIISARKNRFTLSNL